MELAAIILGITCYLASALLAVLSVVSVRQRGNRGAFVLLAAGGVVLFAVLTARGARASFIPAFSRFEALTCYALITTGAYMLMMAVRPARGIAVLLIPYLSAVLLCGLPRSAASVSLPPAVQNGWLVLHVGTAFAGYALLTLASALAGAYLVQDSNLKHKRFGTVWERFPALETLDQLMSRLVGLGFLLLTGAILVGVVLIRQSGGGEEWLTDPKVGSTAVTWVLFAVLVHMRASSDRHGRKMALVTIAGLVGLLFTFIGVHLVAHSVHGFVRILPAY